MPESADPVWFADGLQFACTQCGKCCGGAPGYVWITEDECRVLAERLGLDHAAFCRRYTAQVPGRGLTLLEQPNHDCVFYRPGQGCGVYSDRPKQCRTWPFWRPVVASPEAWAEESAECPGMDSGPRHDPDEIIRIAADDGLA